MFSLYRTVPLILILGLIAFIFWSIQTCTQSSLETIHKISSGFVEVMHVYPQVRLDSQVILTQTVPIAELAVVSKEELVTIRLSEDYQILSWPVPLTQKELQVEASYRIKAGYDLRENFSLNYDSSQKALSITMPQAKILSVEQIDDIKIQSQSELLTQIKDADRNRILHILREKAKTSAQESNLRADADAQIKDRLTKILFDHDKIKLLHFETAPPLENSTSKP